jgi:hypothetical protein
LIQRAAALADATDIIEKLPRGYDTFYRKPVYDACHNISGATKELFGVKKLKIPTNGVGHGWIKESCDFSGGEMQRLAL